MKYPEKEIERLQGIIRDVASSQLTEVEIENLLDPHHGWQNDTLRYRMRCSICRERLGPEEEHAPKTFLNKERNTYRFAHNACSKRAWDAEAAKLEAARAMDSNDIKTLAESKLVGAATWNDRELDDERMLARAVLELLAERDELARSAVAILGDYAEALTECECDADVSNHLPAVVMLRRRFERLLRRQEPNDD